MIVYKITNIVTGKVYIGVTKRTLKARWSDHKECIHTKNYKLYYSMRKHGIENFVIEEIAKAETVEELFNLERKFIIEYDSFNKGYNATIGGDGPTGHVWTKESREKMRIAQTGEKRSPESIAKFSKTMTGRKGRPNSSETRAKISASNKGKKPPPLTEDGKRRISEANSGEKNGMYGQTHSEKSKLLIAEANTKSGDEHLISMIEFIQNAINYGCTRQYQIITYFNENGILTRFGKKWNASSVNYLLGRMLTLPQTRDIAKIFRKE